MDRTERFYKIDQMLNDRRSVTLQDFLHALEVSRATFKRDLEYMRDRLNAPIVWDRELGGYRFERDEAQSERSYALPGLWFNASEIHALLSMQQLLTSVQPGLLEPHIGPLLSRIRGLLDGDDHCAEEVQRRIKVLHMGARAVANDYFAHLSTALLSRRRVRIVHYNRERDDSTERDVSPQRLVHYRDNWYLDAWCHLRRALRSFAVDGLRRVDVLEASAKDVDPSVLDEELGSGYGIFAGRRTQTAKLRFSSLRARWVSNELWHSAQTGHYDKNGYYVLELPFSDSRELLMDILKYGAHVEVLAPRSLRLEVKKAVEAMNQIYQQVS